MRVVVARRTGKRGVGLGNELLSWGKGFLASQALDAALVGPSWGLNQRMYWRNFQSSRFDVMLEDSLCALPHYHFRKEDYYAAGKIPFAEAVRAWAYVRGITGKRHFIVVVDGMYGGYAAIWQARPFLLSRLLSSQDALRNIYRVSSQLSREKLFVAVHMRLGGDFQMVEDGDDVRGKYNIRIPVRWYISICESLRECFGDRVEFRFFADRKGAEFRQAVDRFSPRQQEVDGLSECSDLLLMASADLQVCSVSSYSLAACMLGNGLYVWYEPQLVLDDDVYSLWGHEQEQRIPGSPGWLSAELAHESGGQQSEMGLKGYPVGYGGYLPKALLEELTRRLAIKDPRRNLIEYGCVALASIQGASTYEGLPSGASK